MKAVVIQIPKQYLVQCKYCGDALNSRAGGVYHRGTAWFKQNKSQASGLNSACLAEWSDDWACKHCIHKLVTHVPVNQMELFHLPYEDD